MRTLLILVSLATAAAQEPRFTSDVRLVMVNVQVTERGTGRVLEFLGQNDFEIYDNGTQRPVKEFHFESSPLDVVFLLYSKGVLVNLNDLRDFQRGLREAVRELRAHDRAAVLRSHSASKVDQPMTDDSAKVLDALLRAGGRQNPSGRGGNLYDAVNAAVSLFSNPKNPQRRRTVVALTDDAEQSSKIKLDPLIDQLLEADATLNAVLLVTQSPGGVFVGGRTPIPRIPPVNTGGTAGPVTGASIRHAIDATGGESIPGDALRERIPEMLKRIRMRYLLGFYTDPAVKREFRKIEVRLTADALKRYPNALVRARRGYFTQP